MNYQHLLVTTDGAIATVTLNRPEKRNALALTGDAIDATTAADWGLINRAVPADQLDAATLDLISRATRGSALSKGLGKRGFYQQVDLPQGPAYQLATELMASSAMTPDAQEGMRAFLEKRGAVYTQRFSRS